MASARRQRQAERKAAAAASARGAAAQAVRGDRRGAEGGGPGGGAGGAGATESPGGTGSGSRVEFSTPEGLLGALAEAHQLVAAQDEQLRRRIARCREGGVSWHRIGLVLGLTGEGARKRYSRPPAPPSAPDGVKSGAPRQAT